MIHMHETDPRFYSDPTFPENHGSFSVINYGINNALRKLGHYSEIDDAKFVGYASSLDFDNSYNDKVSFYITVWETINTLTSYHINKLKNSNKILFGMSDQITNLYLQEGIECKTLHCGCDTEFWKPTLPKNEKFTFIHVNSSNTRSGLDLTLQAFDLAFCNNKDVQLIAKDTNQNNPIFRQKISSLVNKGCSIIYISERMNKSQIRDLYSQSHVGLNLLRMTSWGFPLHEMSACGCYCITGDIEPTNVLLNKSFSTLIKPSKEVNISNILGNLINDWGLLNCYGGFAYPVEPTFYDFDIEEYANAMKHIYDNWESHYQNIDTISPIKNNWKWEYTAKNLIKELQCTSGP